MGHDLFILCAGSGATVCFQGSVWINNRSRIVRSDDITYDGVIHHVSTLLTPYSLTDKPVQPSEVTTEANDRGETQLDEHTSEACFPISV